MLLFELFRFLWVSVLLLALAAAGSSSSTTTVENEAKEPFASAAMATSFVRFNASSSSSSPSSPSSTTADLLLSSTSGNETNAAVARSLRLCEDTKDKFQTKHKGARTCEWVGKNKKKRCGEKVVVGAEFTAKAGRMRDCKSVEKKDEVIKNCEQLQRERWVKIKHLCPITCGDCTPPPRHTPAAAPKLSKSMKDASKFTKKNSPTKIAAKNSKSTIANRTPSSSKSSKKKNPTKIAKNSKSTTTNYTPAPPPNLCLGSINRSLHSSRNDENGNYDGSKGGKGWKTSKGGKGIKGSKCSEVDGDNNNNNDADDNNFIGGKGGKSKKGAKGGKAGSSKQPSIQPSNLRSEEPSYRRNSFPSVKPSNNPSSGPSILLQDILLNISPPSTPMAVPNYKPSFQPSAFMNDEPMLVPTGNPSLDPSLNPSLEPSLLPSLSSSVRPSLDPSATPSANPSSSSSLLPSAGPSIMPSRVPSLLPSLIASGQPSLNPSEQSSLVPSRYPSLVHSLNPSSEPSLLPSLPPSMRPSLNPSAESSVIPSSSPSLLPSFLPSVTPSVLSSSFPSLPPSLELSSLPSIIPSRELSLNPSEQPSLVSSGNPTLVLSWNPSFEPSYLPSLIPSSETSLLPSLSPSARSSVIPSSEPSVIISNKPSSKPSIFLSERPSFEPSAVFSEPPTSEPSDDGTNSPSTSPSEALWFQLGTDLGPSESIIANSVALSSDGSTVAVADPTYGGNAGRVLLLQLLEGQNSWDLKGTIDPPNNGVNAKSFGQSISLSSARAGNFIAGAASGGLGNEKWNNGVAYRMVSFFGSYGFRFPYPGNSGEELGWSISMSDNGSRAVIGIDATHVRIVEWNMGNVASQLGSQIGGAESAFSHSVDLSGDGSVVAVGSPTAGHVRIYEYKNNDWVQKGPDIPNEAHSEHFGHSVSLSSNGMVVAVGDPRNDGNGADAGHVSVYEYASTSNAWVKRGTDIDGENAADNFGHSLSLSGDGLVVAVGAPGYDGNGIDSGFVRVYEYSSSDWRRLGGGLNGENAGDKAGSSCSLSSDGMRVVWLSPALSECMDAEASFHT